MTRWLRRAVGRGGWLPVSLCLVVSGALVLGTCTPVVTLDAAGPDHELALTASLSGTFSSYSPGELWGGGNQAEHCPSCNAATLVSEDTAASIGHGAPVDPANGDFTTSLTLVSVPTAAGHFGFQMTYDSQRAIDEGFTPTTKQYDYQDPGKFGWGWQSSLSAAVVKIGTGFVVNEADGAQVDFADIGTTTGEIHHDGCPAGDYPDWQKYTVPDSTSAFCAASRVDAQLGTTTNGNSYTLDLPGGTVDSFSYFGLLTDSGNRQNPDAVSLRYSITPGTTGCPHTTGSGTSCTIETDEVSAGEGITRKIVAKVNDFGVATAVYAPTGAGYTLGYNGHAQLTSVENPTGDTTHFSYPYTRGTQTKGYENEMTSVTDPDGNTSTVAYSGGMVTQLDDPNSQDTIYHYTNDNCATRTGCVGRDTSQTTTVTYEDGETDLDQYQGGVLLHNCYGPGTNTCTDGVQWGFNYTYGTGLATNTETVNMPGGAEATVVTDAADNVVAYTDPNGNTSHEMWNDSGGNDLGELCWVAPPGVGVPSKAVCSLPPQGATSYSYNVYGDQTSVTDPERNTTRSGYYDNGLLCWSSPPSVVGGSTCANGGSSPSGAPTGATTYRYNAESDLVQETVASGTSSVQTTTSNYSEDGRVTDVIPPDGQGHGAFGSNLYETVTNYRASGLVQTTVAPDGLTTAYTYDADGNVVTTTTPSGVTTTGYDQENRACWSHVGTAKVTGTCAHPPSGSTATTYLATTTAPTTVANQEGDVTTYSYADASYPTKATETHDQMGSEVQYAVYNAYGAACISGPVNPGTTSCASRVAGDTWATVNPEGEVLHTDDPSGTATSYTYGDSDFPTEPTAVDYATRTSHYSYDPDGQEVSATDAEGHVVSTAYNTNGQVCWSGPVNSSASCTGAPSGTGVTIDTYNAAGERTTTTDNHGTANAATDHYTYDADGHLVSETTDNGRTTSYAYNDASQVKCIAYPVKSGANCADSPSATNTVVDHTFNAAGELDKTTDWLGNATSYSGYTPKGEVGQITYPSTTGESITYDHNTAGALTAADYSGPAVGSAGDSYGINGDTQLSSVTGLHGFTSPSDTYNDYARVATASAPTAPTSSVNDTFSYRTNGSITSITPSSGPTEVDSYNAQEELTGQSQPSFTSTYPADQATSPISVGQLPYGIAVNPAGTKAYVPNYNSGTVTPITLATRTAGTAISVGQTPLAIAITPNGAKAYVTNFSTDKVTPITLTSGTTGTPITVGSGPTAIAINPAGTKAYVTNQNSNSVTPITLSAGTAGTAIAVGHTPYGIAITPNGAKAYVSNMGSNTVTPITLSAGTAGTPITVGAEPVTIAINPAGTKAYVVDYGSTTVTPITLSANTTGTPIATGNAPRGIAVTPKGTTAYVANFGSNSLTPITLTSDLPGTSITVRTAPNSVAINPAGSEAFVVGGWNDAVTPVTLSERTADSHISVGQLPYGVAVNPAGTKAYVPNYNSGTVTPITLATRTAGTAISVGSTPLAIAINPAGTKAYVTNFNTNKVTPITLSAGTTGTPITVGSGPTAIAVNPAGTKAYVTNQNSDSVTPITLSAGTAGTAIAVGHTPYGIAITPNGAKAYVSNYGSNTVTPITLSAGTAGTPISVGSGPVTIAINPAGTKAYVVDYSSTTVTPITLSAGTAGTAITTATSPRGIAITPDGTTAYVANFGSNSLTPVTLTSGVREPSVAVGTSPDSVAITPNGSQVLVVSASATVTPVSITSTVTKTTAPGFAYNADGERCWSGQTTSATRSCAHAPPGATSYGWTGLGQLCWSGATSATTAGCTAPPTGATTYKYNGTGLRTKETPPSGSALAFTYDTVTSTTPQDIDDGTYAYIYGPTGTAPVEQINLSTGAVSFLSSTPTGVQAVFSSSGSLLEEAAYSPYGEQVIQQGTDVTPFGWQGSYDTSSGLDYMVNRYFTSATADFLSVDPDLPQTGQPYAFANGDPLNESDPLGLKGWYCVATYKTTPGYSTHYFQGTKYGAANGQCVDGHTMAQVVAFVEAELAWEASQSATSHQSQTSPQTAVATIASALVLSTFPVVSNSALTVMKAATVGRSLTMSSISRSAMTFGQCANLAASLSVFPCKLTTLTNGLEDSRTAIALECQGGSAQENSLPVSSSDFWDELGEDFERSWDASSENWGSELSDGGD